MGLLDNKVAIITGASDPFAHAIALGFALQLSGSWPR